jgi:hypothetical protein
MNPRVGSTRCVRYGAAFEEALEHALELQLNRTAGGLALPPHKAGAVVL